MSPANTTSSPRDDHVDANPDLARKKQRLSEDHDDDSAADDTVLVEACEPEDIGASLDTAIEIEDDEHTMVPYSTTFWLRTAGEPQDQVGVLANELASGNFYIRVEEFKAVADWIFQHCEDTKGDPHHEWQQQYLEHDYDFFSKLGHLACLILNTYDLFEPADIPKTTTKQAMQKFFLSLSELSCRIIPLLPEIIHSTLSRRDSALHASAVAQPVELFQYLSIGARSIPRYSDMLRSYKKRTSFEAKPITASNMQMLSQPDVLTALGTIVKMIGGAMRQLKDSWVMLQDVLRVFGSVLTHRQYQSFPDSVFEEIMEVVKACILPAVCAKHPGALPEGFHHELITFGHTSLLKFCQENGHSDACQAYLHFVKSDEDAILHEEVQDDAVPDSLAKASLEDNGALGQLLAASWAMQASIAYVRSDIMNVRNIGLSTLSEHLKTAFEFGKKTGDLDNIYTQHAVRFLRKNEVTKYIFSSDSHASLISESSIVIGFLSATATYTDQETDVIWRACSTSVEADFVKASFGVLENQLGQLDFGHVLYVLKKYGATPIDGLGAAAVDFLPVVLQRLDGFHGPNLGRANRLDLAFSMIDVLKHVDASKVSACSGKLRSILHAGITKFAGNNFTTDDRREIYPRFLPDIGKHAPGASTAAEILTILLRYRLPQEDAEAITSMLPVTAAVEDLQNFVSINRDLPENGFTINSVSLRLSAILRLMSLDPDPPSDNTVKSIFDTAFGEGALCEAARGAAWDKLHSLNAMSDSPPAAVDLWRTYMQRYVPSLPTELANPRLVELITTYLTSECARGAIATDYTLLLRHPLWEALGRFATTSRDRMVVDPATSAITHFLFNYPAHPATPDLREGAVKCQRESVRAHVRALQEDYDQLLGDGTTTKEQDVLQTIDLLHALLFRSKEYAGFYAPANVHDLVVLEPPALEADRLCFTMQVYNAEPQPQILSIQASKSTTVSQLLSSLPPKTGAGANRVIAAGREITGLTAQSLVEAGVQNSGVIQIRPRYKQDFDFDHLLMSAGPVEREIVAHFGALESLMDGPASVAERIVSFLRIMPPTSEARHRVASSTALAEELFPKDRPARAQFSIYVLDWHLRDCARIGIADTRFLMKGVHLLTSVLVDETRELLEPIAPQLVACLHAFLQERPTSDGTVPYFEDGATFAVRMMDRLFEIEHSALENVAMMRPVANGAYGTLLLASQIDSSVWQSFSTSDRSIELHSLLLLHHDANFSDGIARPIRSLCQNSETSTRVSDFFWELLIACLPEALNASPKSSIFFNLASEVLHTTDKIHSNEANARSLVEHLTTALWSYRHTESANALVRDNAMAGLLRLLRDAITILRSFKKPLQLDGLSSRIAEQLLFPDDKEPGSQPIIHEETRTQAYDVLRMTLEATSDFERVVASTNQMTERSVRQPGARFPGPSEWRRGPNECSGLMNLGMTCYMNSMLQQLFGNIQFRKFVLDLPVLYPEKQVLLKQVQSLFARMQSTVEPSQNTHHLAEALGVQIGNQEDVHDFYASLLSRLEDEMPDTDSKIALSKFFTGQSITQIQGECGHVSSQKEAFGDLSVTVKNKANLHDSLAEFVQGEPMEGSNKYKCMSCDPENGRLVDAMRRTCLEDVPDCLTVCLKRFTFGSKFLGEGKVNDRFDFPETVDMSLYKRSHLEAPEQPHDADIFQLVGVIVHQGSLNLGHYWSYVRVPNQSIPGAGDWFCLEDTKTSFLPTGFEVIQQECFGGQRYSNGNERPDNAYVLFYQRKQYVAEATVACRGAEPMSIMPVGLPKIPLGERLMDEINDTNGWRQRIAALFDPKFAHHVCWLLNQYASFKEAKPSGSDSGSSPGMSDRSDGALLPIHETNVGTLMANYVLRILLSDPTCESKLSQTISAFKAALEACPKLAQPILNVFSADELPFETALQSTTQLRLREAVFDLLTTCIAALREQDHHAYMQAIEKLLKVHSSLLHRGFVDKFPRIWNEYFAFPSFVAKQGPQETKLVLESGHFTSIIEILWMSRMPDWKHSHQALWNIMQRDSFVDFDPFFHFLYDLLSEHVDLSDLDLNGEDFEERLSTSHGWSLTLHERKALMLTDDGRHRMWCLFVLAHSHCSTKDKYWRDYGFGKLLGLLVSDKANPTFKDIVADTLVYRYDKEEVELQPLLWATLHYCANADDAECKELLRLLGKTLPLWPQERKCIWFLTEAFPLAPRSVVDSTLTWAARFLTTDKEMDRHATAVWLRDHVFVEQPLSEDHALDASRARVARSLAKILSADVKTAYGQEHPKNKWESSMDILQVIATYISKLADAVTQAQNEGAELPKEVLVERDETTALLPSLGEVLSELEDWESQVVLPTRSMGIRRSVEVDETDDMVSDEEEEFEDFDDISQPM